MYCYVCSVCAVFAETPTLTLCGHARPRGHHSHKYRRLLHPRSSQENTPGGPRFICMPNNRSSLYNNARSESVGFQIQGMSWLCGTKQVKGHKQSLNSTHHCDKIVYLIKYSYTVQTGISFVYISHVISYFLCPTVMIQYYNSDSLVAVCRMPST